MSGSVERAELYDHSTRPVVLEGRTWQPEYQRSASRLELVRAVDDWMPYPVDPGLVAIDLAVASLEEDDETEAVGYLNHGRDALAAVLQDALGPGDLAQERGYLRSRIISGLHRHDLAALSRLTQAMDPHLRGLFAELKADEGLFQRAKLTGIRTLLSTEVAKGGARGLMGDERSVTHVDTAAIDLGVVPPRVFSWEGPERNELRLIRTDGETTMEVRVEVAAPTAAGEEFIAFVRLGERIAETPLRRIGNNPSLRASIAVGHFSDSGPINHMRFGIRHHEVSQEWAARRIVTGEAIATRYLVEAWARLRLGHASIAVGHISAEKQGPLRPRSVYGAAQTALRVLEREREATAGDKSSLAAGIDGTSEQNAVARAAAGTYLRDASQWDPRPVLSGPQRPLISETYAVIDADLAATFGSFGGDSQ